MRQHTAAVLQALFVVFLWGTSWVFVKIELHDIPPVTFAGLRYFLAFVCLLTVLRFSHSWQEGRNLTKEVWGKLIVLGILMYAGTQGAVFVALAYLPAVTVNLLWSFSSVIIAVMGIAFLSEQPSFFQWAGMGLAILGAIIYFYPVEIPINQTIGFLVAILGVLANAAASILGRNINRAASHSPLAVTVVSMGVGSIILLAAGLLFEETPVLNLQNWAIILWLALINTAFAFTLWNHTLRTLSAMESGIINGTMMVWIAIFAVMFLDETLSSKQIVGLLGTSMGTIIVQLHAASLRKSNWKFGNPMITLNCQAILFDLDGTLIESTFYIERLWQDWGSRHGITPQYMSEVMNGRRAVEIVSLVAPHLPVQDEVYALETEEITRMVGMRSYPGAKELLNALPIRQWAIVTSGSLRVASARLNYVKLPTPDVFITADDVKAGKPAPDGYLLAARRLNLKPSHCVVIEDTPAGIQAAKAAGMKVISIASTRPTEMLIQADVTVQQLADIKLNMADGEINLRFN